MKCIFCKKAEGISTLGGGSLLYCSVCYEFKNEKEEFDPLAYAAIAIIPQLSREQVCEYFWQHQGGMSSFQLEPLLGIIEILNIKVDTAGRPFRHLLEMDNKHGDECSELDGDYMYAAVKAIILEDARCLDDMLA
jgi:hypothetical protein